MNLFELAAVIKLDDSKFNQGVKDATKSGEGLAKTIGSKFATAAKVGAAAVGAAATAIGALTKTALDNYAEYEQLVGGVETLFKGSADAVMEYANNAYKTAGLSANAYMETVTGFSASLLQSLGGDTEKAAQYADMAITDMSDNANKMGTDMSSIQNAYQGFAKQNYTMLDNLKLGYGGTKQEMERLLADAEKISGVKYDISSYADVVEAIHVMQESMDIAGTTAKEAASTIQGSVNAMKGAWTNLVTGLADDNADFDRLMSNFIDSIVTAGENLIPRLQTTIGGLTQLVSSASSTIVPLVINTLLNNLPSILSAGVDLVFALVNGMLDNLDLIIDCVLQLIDVIVDKLVENLPKLIDGGIKLTLGIAEGLIKALPELLAKTPQLIRGIVSTLVSNIPSVVKVGADVVKGIWQGIAGMGDWLWKNVKGFFGGIVDGVKNFLGIHSPSRVFAGIGENMAAGLGVGWGDEYDKVRRQVTGDLNFTGTYRSGAPLDIVSGYTPTYSTVRANSAKNSADLTGIYAAVKSLKNAIYDMRIVLDTGAVVGGIVDGVDQSMGTIYSNQQRRAFA